MTNGSTDMADCRCAACGCCKHDHRGWRHEWTATEGDDVQCQSRHPVTDARCVRIAGTHDELATDVYCQRWTDSEVN